MQHHNQPLDKPEAVSPDLVAAVTDAITQQMHDAPRLLAYIDDLAARIFDSVPRSHAERLEHDSEYTLWTMARLLAQDDPAELYRLIVCSGWRRWLRGEWPHLQTLAEAMDPNPAADVVM